jgi:hypothetical protein
MPVKKEPPPYLPAEYTPADAISIQRLSMGKANEDEQKRALDWIINHAAATYQLSYRTDSDRDTVFAEGRRFAGLQIVKMLHMNTLSMGETPDDI